MARAGRKPQGYELIEKRPGSADTKARVWAFVRTLNGELRIEDACRELGIEASRFFDLRNTWIDKSLEFLTPRPAGRPARQTAEDPEFTALKAELAAVRKQLTVAQLQAALREAASGEPASAAADERESPLKKRRRLRKERTASRPMSRR